MPGTRTLLFATLCLVALLAVPAPASAASVSGTVTVENGTADGDRVTITPLDSNLRRTGSQLNTTVDGSTFTASGLPDAPMYFVRVAHEETAHFALVRNGSHVDISLSAEASGRLVDENGDGLSGVRLGLFSESGPMVTTVETGENGTFSFEPLRPNATYYLQYTTGGIPYNHSVKTASGETAHRIVAQQPTTEPSALRAVGENPASHVFQIAPPQNGSQPMVVETLTLRNTGDRPFVGAVTLQVPETANVTAAMYRDRRIPVVQRDGAVSINASVAPGQSARVGIAYTLQDKTLERTLQYNPDNAAVVVQGYDLSAVEHSSNLESVNSSLSLLVAENLSGENATISITLPGAAGGLNSTAPGAFSAPVTVLLAGLFVVVLGGLLAYRVV